MKTLLILILTASQIVAADPISDALQKGLFEEEANHNLDAAIKAYQSVIDQTAEQRRLSATAVFRLGECYRKLNKTNEAVSHYQRVVREFSDHTNLVEFSRQKLTGLGVAVPDRASQKPLPSSLDQEKLEIERYQRLAKDSPDLLNAKDSGGEAPLHKAASGNYPKVVEFLLTNKAEVNLPNAKGTTPLHYAVYYGRKSNVELLLKYGADVNAIGSIDGDSAERVTAFSCQPLHMAAYNGNQSIAELLLAHKAEVNGTDYRRRTPLHFAVDRGFLGFCQFLISKGADVNMVDERGRSAAMSAASSGYENILRALLENGADVNAQDQNGNTLAHHGASQRSPGLLQAVLERKPNLNLQNTSAWTPLIQAIVAHNLRAVDMFLKAGADPNGATTTGAFPLMNAVMWLNKDAVRLLLAHKADTAQQTAGETPLARALSMAEEEKRPAPDRKAANDIADLLRQHGAKELAGAPYIGFSRNGKTLNRKYLKQDPHRLNHFTLYELLAYMYSGRGPEEGSSVWSLPKFPDFSNIQITRTTTDGATEVIKLNLGEALVSGDCSKDVPLEWGDIVDVPESDHKLSESWDILPAAIRDTLSKCLERNVTVAFHDETTALKLRPRFWRHNAGSWVMFSPSKEASDGVPFLRLRTALEASKLLRASSDKSRVKVTRKMRDGIDQEFIFNLEDLVKGQPQEDLLLRDGDKIFVPKKE